MELLGWSGSALTRPQVTHEQIGWILGAPARENEVLVEEPLRSAAGIFQPLYLRWALQVTGMCSFDCACFREFVHALEDNGSKQIEGCK